MNSLLPPNATDIERDIETVLERSTNIPVPTRDLWNHEDCPVDLLPWLAWALSVDEWRSDWTTQQKRAAIGASVGVHQIKGTTGAVQKALAALGIDVQVQEWYRQTPNGVPHSYKVLLQSELTPVTKDGINTALRVIDKNKAQRSSLSSVEISAKSMNHVYIAAASAIGSEINVKVQAPPLIINQLAVVG